MRTMAVAALGVGLLPESVAGVFAEGASQGSFVIAGRVVQPGQRADLDVPVAAGQSDPATVVPVTVFHGASSGPVLALTVGVHGYEYPPILAAQQLLTRIDPARLSGVDTGRSLNRQAVADGKPTVLVEIGQNGRRDAAFVDPIVKGVDNLLRVLKMLPGAPDPPRDDTRWFDDTTGVSATVTGIFTPVATTARSARKGDLIATITDYAGREVERVVMPVDGYVMYGLAGPSVRAGETAATIGLPAKGPL